MPIHRGKDANGPYYQWGGHGSKYYYKVKSKQSRLLAYKKAERQMGAAFANGYRGK